jgi:type I restriction enzyme S subunit
MSRKAYPKYKPSGIEWLGKVPEHWEVEKLKRISSITFSNVDKNTTDGEDQVRLCNYLDVYRNEFITSDLNFMVATATLGEMAKFTLKEGDVIVTKDSEAWDDIAIPAYVSSDLKAVLCGYHLAQIRPTPNTLDGKYLFRSFCSRGINDQFRVAATGITRYGLGKYWLDNGLFLVPPIEEQRDIAAFLDRETARIDALIEKKQRQIELLKEKRGALISHAVTKGLNPDVKMKDSGIDWLGEIPEHWNILQLRRVVNRFVDYRGRTPTKTDDGVPLITAGAVKDGVINHSLVPEYMAEEDYTDWMSRGLPEEGDIVITTEAPLGEVALVQNPQVAFAQRIILFKVNYNSMIPEFLRYYYLSYNGKTELLSRASGSTATGIRSDRLRMSLVLVPPLKEQKYLVEYLDPRIALLAMPIARIEYSIEKLREYRTALISATVTGKIDVRKEVTV